MSFHGLSLALPCDCHDIFVGFHGLSWHLMDLRALAWASTTLPQHLYEMRYQVYDFTDVHEKTGCDDDRFMAVSMKTAFIKVVPKKPRLLIL